MAATTRQIAKIWAAAREIGLEDRSDVYDLVHRVTDKRSISELTFAEATRVIDRLVQLGATAGDGKRKKPSGEPREPGVVKMMRKEQWQLIQDLRAQLGGKWTDEEYYAGRARE